MREKETNLILEGEIEQVINEYIYDKIGDGTDIYNTEDCHQMYQDIADILNDEEDVIEIK